jgi:hypothetical protein
MLQKLFLPLTYAQFVGEKSLLLIDCCFFHGNPDLVSCVFHASFVIMQLKQLKYSTFSDYFWSVIFFT